MEDVKDWEALASRLRISRTTILNTCATSTTVAQCHRKMVVETYCDMLSSGDPHEVALDIADVLEGEMGTGKLAERLREFKFTKDGEFRPPPI